METKEILSTSNSKQTQPQSCLETSRANSHLGAGKGRFLREVMCIGRKKKGKSKVLSRGFRLRDSEAEQKALQFLHIHCSNVNSPFSVPESNRLNQPYRIMDLPFFFRYKELASLKSVPSPARLPYWFQGNFKDMFVLNSWLREFLLPAFANRFELRCEPKQLMLLYYKICTCLLYTSDCFCSTHRQDNIPLHVTFKNST